MCYCSTIKPTKSHGCQLACVVWIESLLYSWRSFGSLATNRAQVKTDQTAQMCRLIWVFAGSTCDFVVHWLIHMNCSMTKPTKWRAPREDSDQPGYLPSLIRAFAVHMKKPWVLGYPWSAQRRLWSDWADAQADLNLCWAHRSFCWFCHAAAYIFLLVFTVWFSCSQSIWFNPWPSGLV